MQSADDRHRLIGEPETEPASPLGAVLKCAAGILVLVIVAAGPWVLLSAGGPTAANGGHPASQAGAMMAESKRVFNERRAGYEAARKGGAEGRLAATREQPGL